MAKHTVCYKTLDIYMEDAVQRIHSYFSPCLVHDASGIYWDGSYFPVIRADDECVYTVADKDYTARQLMDLLLTGMPPGMANRPVYRYQGNKRLVTVIPGAIFNMNNIRVHDDQHAWAFNGQSYCAAATAFVAMMGDYIRQTCNSHHHPLQTFDVADLLISDSELGRMALSDTQYFDVEIERYSRMIEQGVQSDTDYDTVLSEIGKDVADQLIMNMRKCVANEIEKVAAWIGPHIDNIYTYRIVGRKYILSQGVDYRAQKWVDQCEAESLSSIE